MPEKCKSQHPRARRGLLFRRRKEHILQKIIIIFVVVACMLALSPLSADACTAFRLKAKDGSIIVGRSMEFVVDLRVGLQASIDRDYCENHNLLLYRQW